jgi:hypothetical protein
MYAATLGWKEIRPSGMKVVLKIELFRWHIAGSC